MNRQEIEAWLMARSLRRHAAAQAGAHAGALLQGAQVMRSEADPPCEAAASGGNGGASCAMEAGIGSDLAEEAPGTNGCSPVQEAEPEPGCAAVPAAHETHAEVWDGRPRQSRRRATGVDLRLARCARWADVVGLMHGRTPDYLVPLLAYALGAKPALGAMTTQGGERSQA